MIKNSQKFIPHTPGTDSHLEIDIKVDSVSLWDLCKKEINHKTVIRKGHRAVADTGAAICCAPVQEIKELGLKQSDVMRSTLRLYAADGRRLEIEGCIPVQITAHMQTGLGTIKEMLYFINSLDQVFLSKEALIALGAIHEQFPKV